MVISACYFVGLTPGHVFVQDDFAAYVMHAANIVEGRPYAEIRYVPNAQAPWVSPANGYPPVYPLLLAPAYRLQGLDLRAMKIITVFTFVIYLVMFASRVRPLLPPALFAVAILLVGLNPAFWTYHDLIASELPYMMFSLLGMVAIGRAGRDLRTQEWRPRWALVVAVLLYATYGTRTIGIALAAAFALADVVRFKRPSRFLILFLGLLAIFIVAQSGFVSSPKGYLSVTHVSLASVSGNLWSYTKSLSYLWENGFSKAARVLLAVMVTTPAAIAFCRRFSRKRSPDQFYLLVYLAILIAWGAQIGIRGLLPILPIYLAYSLLGVSDALRGVRQHSVRLVFAGSLAIGVGVTYAGALHQPPWQASQADVLDPSRAGDVCLPSRADESLGPDRVFQATYDRVVHRSQIGKPRARGEPGRCCGVSSEFRRFSYPERLDSILMEQVHRNPS